MNRTQFEYVLESWNEGRRLLTRAEVDDLAHFLTVQEAHWQNQGRTFDEYLLPNRLETRPVLLRGAFYRFAQPDGSALEVRGPTSVQVQTDERGRPWLVEVPLAPDT